jgi:hypothetical protein
MRRGGGGRPSSCRYYTHRVVVAIVEPGAEPQPMWEQVKKARNLTQCQAVVSAVIKLIFWHWSQPAVYLWVLGVYRCYIAKLGPAQQDFAAVVAAREVLYLCSTVLAAWQCPVFLLMDPVSAWGEADGLESVQRAALYVFTPHNYTALCLANRFRGWRRAFLGLAGTQVIADLASCFALGALMAGGIKQPNGVEPSTPTAMIIGYSITASGFLLFFGPLSVVASLRGAADPNRHSCVRAGLGLASIALLCALLYIVVLFVVLAGGWFNPYCDGFTFNSDPCNSHGHCYGAGLCLCEFGFGPAGGGSLRRADVRDTRSRVQRWPVGARHTEPPGGGVWRSSLPRLVAHDARVGRAGQQLDERQRDASLAALLLLVHQRY